MYGKDEDLIETFEGHSDVVKEFVWRKGNNGICMIRCFWSPILLLFVILMYEERLILGIYSLASVLRELGTRLELLDHGWFYGPENPGHYDEPNGGFKDEHGAVKRQVKFFPSVTFHWDDLIFKPFAIWSGSSIPSLRN